MTVVAGGTSEMGEWIALDMIPRLATLTALSVAMPPGSEALAQTVKDVVEEARGQFLVALVQIEAELYKAKFPDQ